MVLILRGYDKLLSKRQHLAIQAAIRLHELEQAFSSVGDQFIVVYEGRMWTS